MNPTARRAVRTLTPKEFSEAIGGIYCADTIRAMCQRGELATVRGAGNPPYYIRPEELTRFQPVVTRFLVTV